MYSHHKNSSITDQMLEEEGCAPDKLCKKSRDIWIADIQGGRYTVKVVTDKGKARERDQDEVVEHGEAGEEEEQDDEDSDDGSSE